MDMPEGHTIHRLARDHTPLLAGRPIAVSSPQGRFADAQLVDGHVLVRIEPYGKHLFYVWSNGLVGHVHLGLFGKFRVTQGAESPPAIGEVRMRLRSDVATVDLAGPTACTVDPPEVRQAILARLGPDPLRRDAERHTAEVVDRVRRKVQPIGQVLLDQQVIAGIGNVYRAEMLFVHGIHPGRSGSACSADDVAGLWETARAMLRRGVRDNRIVTIDRRLIPQGRRLRRGDTTFVYHRDRCLRCETVIQTITLGGRPCYFCPACQPS